MDSGEILMDGERVHLRSPKDAIALGIGMVHQEFMLLPPFSVVENTVLGLREGRGPLLDLKRASERLKELSNRHGLALDPAAKVGALSVGAQQRVEIVKLLYRDAQLLILDEPTAVLTPQEKDRLFVVLRRLREDGCSVVIVTHKIKEIMEIADRVTVMRDGQAVANKVVQETSERELTRLMVGREVILRADKAEQQLGALVLEIKELRVEGAAGRESLRGVSLEVHSGEILGIAGIEGNGQSELAEAVMHLREVKTGHVVVNGTDVTKLSVGQCRAMGISYVPADRRRMGSVVEMSVADNAILGLQRKYRRGLFRSIRDTHESALGLITRFGIRASSIDAAAGKLSGGNLQKLILGREITRGSGVLIVEQPTRGLDVAAVASIWGELLRARQEGKAILLISAELEELLNLSDRIAVMFEGCIMGTVNPAGASMEQIGRMMAGISTGIPSPTPSAMTGA
jgi:simple sugar transport system ATP-binding protein